MANEIGPLAIKAVVNAKGVDAGIDETKAKVSAGVGEMAKQAKRFADTWSAGIAGGIKSGIAGIKGWGDDGGAIFKKAMGDPGRFLSDNIIGGMANAAGRIPMLGPLLALPFEGLHALTSGALDTYKEGAERIREVGTAALKANTDLAGFQVISGMVGDLDLAAKGMVKFKEALGQAAIAGTGAKNAFTALGLDAAALASGPDSKAWVEFSEAIKQTGNSFLQTHYAIQVFGKSAVNMMPVILRGAEGFNKQKGLIDTFGAGFSEKDFGSIRAADLAGKQFKMLQEGFTNQVTIGVAPILAELAEGIPKLSDLGITFDGLAGSVINFAETVSKAGAAMIAGFGNTKIWTAAWDVTIAYLDALLDKFVSSAITKIAGIGGSVGRLAAGLIGAGSIALGNSGGASGAGNDASLARLQAATAALNTQAADSQVFGSIDKFFTGVRDRFAGLKQAAKINDPFAIWGQSALNLQDSIKGPMDKFREEIQRVQALSANGPKGPWAAGDALNQFFGDAGFLAAGKAVQHLRSAYGSGGASMLSGAYQQGTAGAASAINQARFSARDTLEDLLKEANRQRDELINQGKNALNDPALKVILRGVGP